jgi:hypothetical protein
MDAIYRANHNVDAEKLAGFVSNTSYAFDKSDPSKLPFQDVKETETGVELTYAGQRIRVPKQVFEDLGKQRQKAAKAFVDAANKPPKPVGKPIDFKSIFQDFRKTLRGRPETNEAKPTTVDSSPIGPVGPGLENRHFLRELYNNPEPTVKPKPSVGAQTRWLDHRRALDID